MATNVILGAKRKEPFWMRRVQLNICRSPLRPHCTPGRNKCLSSEAQTVNNGRRIYFINQLATLISRLFPQTLNKNSDPWGHRIVPRTPKVHRLCSSRHSSTWSERCGTATWRVVFPTKKLRDVILDDDAVHGSRSAGRQMIFLVPDRTRRRDTPFE